MARTGCGWSLTVAVCLTIMVSAGCRTTAPDRVDRESGHPSFRGRVLCGYQGWFRCPGDGSGMGWIHWCRDPAQFRPEELTVDLWPDMGEYGEDECFPVPGLQTADGSPAYAFSSHNPATVDRHFRWMAEYGIDGVVFQHFAVDLPEGPLSRRFESQRRVLNYVRDAARRHGRAWAMSYDTASMPADRITDAVSRDWRRLVDAGATGDPGYVYEDGRPVLVIWGLYRVLENMTADVGNALVDALRTESGHDPFLVAGGDWDWRRDVTPEWIGLLRRFDAYIPWNVGNLVRDEGGELLASTGFWEEDKAAVEHELGLLWVPVAYPGFTWDNVRLLPPGSSLVPRRGGHFLWNQFYRMREVGAECGFVAMFDEVDEGTAVFKVADPPPRGAHLVGLEGRSSDWYLRLVGAGTRMVRGEDPIRAEMPCSESVP